MEKKREEICLVQKVCMGQNGHSPQWIIGANVFFKKHFHFEKKREKIQIIFIFLLKQIQHSKQNWFKSVANTTKNQEIF